MVSGNNIGLIFETIREPRGPGLFVDYQPANENKPFSSLFLVYADYEEGMEAIANRIEKEAMYWFSLYPAPLVASAVDSDDNPIDVSGGNDRLDLLVYSCDGEVVTEWGRLGEFDMPSFNTDPDNLLRMYPSINYSTMEQRRQRVDKEVKKQRTRVRIIVGFLFARRAVVPAAVALAFYLHPVLGIIGLIGTLADATIGGLRVLGYIPKTKREQQEEEKQRRMEHHDYHCQLKPRGFVAIKAENLGESLREKVRQEARDFHNEHS